MHLLALFTCSIRINSITTLTITTCTTVVTADALAPTPAVGITLALYATPFDMSLAYAPRFVARSKAAMTRLTRDKACRQNARACHPMASYILPYSICNIPFPICTCFRPSARSIRSCAKIATSTVGVHKRAFPRGALIVNPAMAGFLAWICDCENRLAHVRSGVSHLQVLGVISFENQKQAGLLCLLEAALGRMTSWRVSCFMQP